MSVDNPFKNEDMIQKIKEAKIGDIVEVEGENTSGKFYKGLYSWLHRNGYPFDVRCKTIRGAKGNVLHVQKIEKK